MTMRMMPLISFVIIDFLLDMSFVCSYGVLLELEYINSKDWNLHIQFSFHIESDYKCLELKVNDFVLKYESEYKNYDFIFKISDKMTAQIKKPVTHKERKVWQVKEMEENYEHETGSGFRGNKGSTEQ